MAALPPDVLSHLERVDPDRVLASRLVEDAGLRGELLALYALDDELARVAASVRDPRLGEIRLAWWTEALERLAVGEGGRGQPVLEALAPAVSSGRLPLTPLLRAATAREADLPPEPFADEAALLAYLDDTAGAVMAAGAALLAPVAASVVVTAAGRAWGWSALWRAREAWSARGRSWRPRDGALPAEPEALLATVRARVRAARAAAGAELRALPTAAFPAVAYAALAPGRLREPPPGPLRKRLTLLAASLRGRV